MDSKNRTETLTEKVNAITNMPVATSINNVQQLYLATSKKLRELSIQEAGTVINMLSSEFQLRQDVAKNAIDEYKHAQAIENEAKAAEAARKLAAEQKEIEEANRPRLVPVGGGPVQ